MRVKALLALALAGFTFSSGAWSAVTFSTSAGTRAASASFDIVAGKLQVVLTNTSTFDVTQPIDVLTAVFFNVSGANGASQLTPFSALSGGITYLNGVQKDAGSVAGQNLGGEWGYDAVANGNVPTANAGISSSGLGGLFGQPNFNGPNLEANGALDGLQYGIASAGDNPTSGNGGVMGNEITKSSVTFLLTVAGGFNLAQISNLYFQYGTAMDEPRLVCCGQQQVPTPGTWLLAAAGIAALGWRRRAALALRTQFAA